MPRLSFFTVRPQPGQTFMPVGTRAAGIPTHGGRLQGVLASRASRPRELPRCFPNTNSLPASDRAVPPLSATAWSTVLTDAAKLLTSARSESKTPRAGRAADSTRASVDEHREQRPF
jgi:hypothetical protein